MKFARSFAVLLGFATMTGFTSDDTYTLKQTYKKDDVQSYRMSFNVSAEDTEFTFSCQYRYKVLSVEEDGSHEMEETLVEGTMKANGEETVLEKTDPKIKKYDKNGKEVKKTEEGEEEELDPVSKVIGEVFEYEPKAAVKLGESWKVETSYGVMTATLEAKEKLGEVDCLKVSIKGKMDKKDTAGDVSGTFFIRTTDFSPEKMEAVIDNPVVEEGVPMKKIEVKLERVKE